MLLIQISPKKEHFFKSYVLQLHRFKIFKAPFKRTNLRGIWREIKNENNYYVLDNKNPRLFIQVRRHW
jgi:hypothetical protein